jgi:hypothetical protein
MHSDRWCWGAHQALVTPNGWVTLEVDFFLHETAHTI